VKEFWKSINISQSYAQKNFGVFFMPHSVDIGVNANLELEDKFCYLGDMLSVDGDAEAAVENRIWFGWI